MTIEHYPSKPDPNGPQPDDPKRTPQQDLEDFGFALFDDEGEIPEPDDLTSVRAKKASG